MNPLSLKDTIVPKSDQLNADDLLTGPLTVTITGVRRGDKEQPVIVEIQGQRPYKPCKSMRRVLISAWGDDGHAWAGHSMTLFADPNVMFGGVKVGGIRISHVSHIDAPLNLSLTTTRSKRAEYVVQPLRTDQATNLCPYPADRFEQNFPAWRDAIMAGRYTVAKIIPRIGHEGTLSDEQRDRLEVVGVEFALQAALNMSELAEAASGIVDIASETERARLKAIYDERVEGMPE
jgi:hypothetical protein